MQVRLIALSLVFCLCGFDFAQAASTTDVQAEVERRAISFFIENAHPATGFVRDRAENFLSTPEYNAVASIASTGFSLAVIANAGSRGLVDPKFAEQYVLKALRHARDLVSRHHGWFLHWVSWSTGRRIWMSEYSTIDTALFVAGALYAAQVYPGGEIAQIANQLYNDLDFNDMLTDGGQHPDKTTLSMGYSPGQGYIPAQWNMYAEQMILVLLGLGHPTHPLPASAWFAFGRDEMQLPNVSAPVMGLGQGIFVHQYSQLFVDLRRFQDHFPNYFANSVEVTRLHRAMTLDPSQSIATLKAGFWGFSAGEAPHHTYRVYSALSHGSTVCLGCALGSAMFLPEVLQDMTTWYNSGYHDRIFGRYGFIDSLDIDKNWFATTVLGITVGPLYLSLANTQPQTSIWSKFMQDPNIQIALQRAAQPAPANAKVSH